ncbi:unnamed protein product [Caenorhabditis nigoni]
MRLEIKQINFQFDCLEINNFGSKNLIQFRNYSEEMPAMTFHFDTDYYDWGWKIKIGEKKVEMRGRRYPTNEYCCQTKDFESDLQNLLDYFSSIFHFKSGFAVIELDSKSQKLRKLIAHPIFNNRLVLQLSGILYSYTGLDSLIQENYENIEGFVADFEFGNLFDYREILKFKHCSFNYAKSFTRRDLLTLEFQNLKLQNHRLTGEDVNSFIKSWLAGNHKNLEHLGISKNFGLEDIEDVSHGLETVKWEETKRDGHFLLDSIRITNLTDCRQGLDVQRADGTIGTMVFKNDHFLFLVWKVPFVGRIDQ